MKRVILITVCCIFSLGEMCAQNTMSAEEVAFRSGVERFLKEEGFVPTIDSDDNSLVFKKEGDRYWMIFMGTSPTYIEFHKAGYDMEGTNRKNMIEACNKACCETRCAKAYVTKSVVSFTAECYCQTANDFKYIFYRLIDTLDTAKDKVKKYYNELDK